LDEFGPVRALHSVLAAPLPPEELVLAQRLDEEQAPPVKPPAQLGAPLPEKPRKQVAPQVAAESPGRARQALLPQPAAQARLRASVVWPWGRT